MIAREYCQTMARYNARQNKGLIGGIQAHTASDLTNNRGAFFGSIAATASHLYWGDDLWMSRFANGPKPECGIKANVGYIAVPDDWVPARTAMDQRILDWAAQVAPDDLTGDYSWFSRVAGREVSKPWALAITHFFNHQTHHCGQLHALLTQCCLKSDDSDLFLLEDRA